MPKRKRNNGDKWVDLLSSDIGTEVLSFMPPVPDQSGLDYDEEASLKEWEEGKVRRENSINTGEWNYQNYALRSYYEAHPVDGRPKGYHHEMEYARAAADIQRNYNLHNPDDADMYSIDEYDMLSHPVTGYQYWKDTAPYGSTYKWSTKFDRSRATVNKFKKHYFGF